MLNNFPKQIIATFVLLDALAMPGPLPVALPEPVAHKYRGFRRGRRKFGVSLSYGR